MSDEAREFLKRLKPFKELDDLENRGRILIQKDKVYLVPDSYEDNNGLRTLRQGLLLGEMKKNRFLPCQALANALKPDDFDSVLNYSSDNPDIIRYLKCETLTTDVDNKHGWQLVSVDDFPLGWGKLSNNILKTCICLDGDGYNGKATLDLINTFQIWILKQESGKDLDKKRKSKYKFYKL